MREGSYVVRLAAQPLLLAGWMSRAEEIAASIPGVSYDSLDQAVRFSDVGADIQAHILAYIAQGNLAQEAEPVQS